jgi:peptidoglycan/LPS O-acetylase OafA/YrhL
LGYSHLTGKRYDRLWFTATAGGQSICDLKAFMTSILLYPFTIGWSGVAMFFVISGFCIHLSFMNLRTGSFGTFYIRRLFRIYPPYLFALLAFAIVFPGTQMAFSKLAQWAQLGTHMLFVHNYVPWCLWGINPDFWSIAVEVQLYLLFPALLLAVRRWGWRNALVVLGVIECGSWLSILLFRSHFSSAFYRPPLLYWFSWSLGVLVADKHLNSQTLDWFRRIPAWIWFVFALAAGELPEQAFAFTLFALFTASVLCKRLNRAHAEVTTLSMAGRHLRTAGLWSYSIYLLHHPVPQFVLQTACRLNPQLKEHPVAYFLVGVCTWAIVFPIGGLMYRFVEVPSVSLGKAFLVAWTRRERQPVAV